MGGRIDQAPWWFQWLLLLGYGLVVVVLFVPVCVCVLAILAAEWCYNTFRSVFKI